MTDFSKTLEDYERIGAENMLTQLSVVEQETKEKIHLISVLGAIEGLKKIIRSENFSSDTTTLRVQYDWDQDGCYLNTDIWDEQWGGYEKINRQIYLCLAAACNDESFFASAYKKNNRIDFKCTEQGVEDLKNNVLLNDKLKAVLEKYELGREVKNTSEMKKSTSKI